MAKKKADPGAKKRAAQIQGRFRKAGPMKNKGDKRRAQKQRYFDDASEK